MENRKLWGITADSSSDLFCRSWVMSTLKPPAGRKWGSPLGSYHSSVPPGNRRESAGLPHLRTLGIKDTQCVAWLLVEVGQFPQQTLAILRLRPREGPAKVRKYIVTPESFPHTWYLKLSPHVDTGCMKFNFWLLVPLQRLLSEFSLLWVTLCWARRNPNQNLKLLQLHKLKFPVVPQSFYFSKAVIMGFIYADLYCWIITVGT